MRDTPHYRPTRAEHEIIEFLLSERPSPDELALHRRVRRDTIYKQLSALYERTETNNVLKLVYWSYQHRNCCLGIGSLIDRLLLEADS